MSLLNKIALPLIGSYVFKSIKYSDNRGSFTKYFDTKNNEEIFKNFKTQQINFSTNILKGTIRGLHFQNKPYQEKKIVFCIRGKIWDVIIDLRKNSKTYLNWYGMELSNKNSKIIYIPKGFAHGYQTLTNNTEIVYIHDGIYNKEKENGINYKDKQLNIKWPLKVTNISYKDKNLKSLKNAL